MKLSLVKRAIEDEPERRSPAELSRELLDEFSPHLNAPAINAIFMAGASCAKANILARIEEYRKNPPPKSK